MRGVGPDEFRAFERDSRLASIESDDAFDVGPLLECERDAPAPVRRESRDEDAHYPNQTERRVRSMS